MQSTKAKVSVIPYLISAPRNGRPPYAVTLHTCIVSLTQHVTDDCVAGVGGEYELLGKVRIDQDICVCESGL